MEPYSFHLDQWLPLFPLDDPAKQQPGGFSTTNPGGIAIIEQIRARAGEAMDLGETVPADIHVSMKYDQQHSFATWTICPYNYVWCRCGA